MLLTIALGGAAGSLARYGIGTWAQRYGAGFPVGTLLINVLGSLALGFILRASLPGGMSQELRAGLTVGFCGGFTTFSTFSFETAALIEGGAWTRAALYVTGSVLLSLLAMLGGFALARLWLQAR